jgi:superfamily II DNA or RNA helicase
LLDDNVGNNIMIKNIKEIPMIDSFNASIPSILNLKFPFNLTKDQHKAVEAWFSNKCRGSIIYSTGTGKTEIAFECARRRAAVEHEKKIKPDNNNIVDCNTNNNNNNNNNYPYSSDNATTATATSFNILFLVPRIVLIEQNLKRLLSYHIPKESIGVYFGERKEIREITISTYQSIINKLGLIRNSNMIIFDEMHLLTDSAITLRKIFDVLLEEDNSANKKALLGLTATIDEQDPNYNTVVSLLPPVKKYMIREAVEDGRLAKPIVIPIKVKLTFEEKKLYDNYSTKIRNISDELNISDPQLMSSLLRKWDFSAKLARSWFENVRNRKNLINCAQDKLSSASDLIATKHPSDRIMVFSETIESIKKLKDILEKEKGIRSMIIESKLKSKDRQAILSKWGTDFYPLLSVHTLEIGYDVPQVRIAIILASTSNINQAAQRIGRILRKAEGKNAALIYTIYLSGTHDYNHLGVVKQATQMDGKRREAYSNNNNNNNSGTRSQTQTAAAATNYRLDSFFNQ